MKKSNLLKRGVLHSLGVIAYISLLIPIMTNGEKIFGAADNRVLSPLIFLLLFIISALVTGSLVLAKPLMLYLDGSKREAVRLLVYTGASLFIWLLIFMLILFLIK
jgi:hypothetical protein